MRHKAVGLAVLLVALCAARSAQAQDPKEEAKKLVTQAETEFKLGRFQQALDLYSRAYETYKAPGLFFNIGQCHYRLGNWERAIFFYESFLREKPNAPNRTTVEELIADARRELDKMEASARTAEERKRMEEERRLEEEKRASAEAQAKLVAEQNKRPLEPERPVYKKWWFWVAVVGTVAIAGGATAYYLSGETERVPPEGSLGVLDLR